MRSSIAASAPRTSTALACRRAASYPALAAVLRGYRAFGEDVLQRASIFVDHEQTTKRSGDFLDPYARGVITPADVKGDLFALCQGTVAGRRAEDEITMMKNGGGSHIDYFVSRYLVERLRKAKVGAPREMIAV